MMLEADSTQTSRGRLLAAGKFLFARVGYEQASTSAIAREAGTSESQLVRYFGGKAGLLQAIFNEAWSALNEQVTAQVSGAANSRQAIVRMLLLVMEAFGRDHDLAFLFLFEGRRVRGQEVVLSKGFVAFYDAVHNAIRRGQAEGSFRSDISVSIIASALLGCAEGMIRDRMIAERNRELTEYDEPGIRAAFEAIINALGPAQFGVPSPS